MILLVDSESLKFVAARILALRDFSEKVRTNPSPKALIWFLGFCLLRHPLYGDGDGNGACS
jgi:hypothetical protein